MKVIRIFVDDLQAAERLCKIKIAFKLSDDFMDIVVERVVKQQITGKELDWVVNYLIENHRGNLYIADIVEVCKTAKDYRLPDYALCIDYELNRIPPDARKWLKFEE